MAVCPGTHRLIPYSHAFDVEPVAELSNLVTTDADFIGPAIVGLDTAVIRARAAEVELPSGRRLKVLHPLDGLEVRDAVPASRIAVPSFHSQRWPRVLEDVAELRRRHAARQARQVPRPQGG